MHFAYQNRPGLGERRMVKDKRVGLSKGIGCREDSEEVKMPTHVAWLRKEAEIETALGC